MLKNEHILIYIEKLSTPVSVVEKTFIFKTKTFTKTFVKRYLQKLSRVS